MRFLLAAALACVPLASAAETCDEARARVRADVTTRLRLDERRTLARTIAAGLTPAENAEFAALSARFNALPHVGDGITERFALQARARELTRGAVERAGLRPLNPANGSPYDAVVERSDASLVELRTMLVLRDPRPHAATWLLRRDAASNPWGLHIVGVASDPGDDYAYWFAPDGRRVGGSFAAFVETRLPAGCR